MFVQFFERRSVEDVRSRFGTIESKQANVIVADLASDNRISSNCRHRVHIGHFPANSKRNSTGGKKVPNEGSDELLRACNSFNFYHPAPLLWAGANVKNAGMVGKLLGPEIQSL